MLFVFAWIGIVVLGVFIAVATSIPLKIAEPFPPEKIMNFRLIEEVKKEFQAKIPGR